MTITPILLGALLGFLAAHLLEDRREQTARTNQLRNSKARWRAQHIVLGTEFDLLVSFIEQPALEDPTYSSVLSDLVTRLRLTTIALVEVGYEVWELTTSESDREPIDHINQVLQDLLILATQMVRSARTYQFSVERIRAMRERLNKNVAGHTAQAFRQEHDSLDELSTDLDKNWKPRIAEERVLFVKLAKDLTTLTTVLDQFHRLEAAGRTREPRYRTAIRGWLRSRVW